MKIGGLGGRECFEGEEVDFELNPEINWQPVKSMEQWYTGGAWLRFGHNPGKAVLNSL